MTKSRWHAAVLVIAGSAVLALSFIREGHAEAGARLALVIGNMQYHDAPVATAANDASLIAQTLRTAGFDVTGAADVDKAGLQKVFQDFASDARSAGPSAVVFVYFAGHALQYKGQNFLVPVDAALAHDADIPAEAVPLAEITSDLTALPVQARIVVVDAVKANPFVARDGLASGLAMMDAEPGSLIAYNTAPGLPGIEEKGTYGAYAQGLAEILRYGGLKVDDVFVRLRMRVNAASKGNLVPWETSRLAAAPIIFAEKEDASSLMRGLESFSELKTEPMRNYQDPDEAYTAAVARDTLSGYQEFVSAFPGDMLEPRVQYLIAMRREALTWNLALRAHRPDVYWNYLRRYPRGPHAADAKRLLAEAGAPDEPPPRLPYFDFLGLPAPDEEEAAILSHSGPLAYAAVPAVSERFLLPLPQDFRKLPAPEPREGGGLPTPAAVNLPYARPAARMGAINPPQPGQDAVVSPGEGGEGQAILPAQAPPRRTPPNAQVNGQANGSDVNDLLQAGLAAQALSQMSGQSGSAQGQLNGQGPNGAGSGQGQVGGSGQMGGQSQFGTQGQRNGEHGGGPGGGASIGGYGPPDPGQQAQGYGPQQPSRFEPQNVRPPRMGGFRIPAIGAHGGSNGGGMGRR